MINCNTRTTFQWQNLRDILTGFDVLKFCDDTRNPYAIKINTCFPNPICSRWTCEPVPPA